MAEHPDVTLTPAQARQVRWALPYELPPELSAKFMRFSETILTLACALIQLDHSAEREAALHQLQLASRDIQVAFTLEQGTPRPPSWLHIAEEETP